MKKKLISILALLFISVLCVSCRSSDDEKTVKIAIMGDYDLYYDNYNAFVTQVVDDLNKEYADKGFRFEYSFYEDNSSYEKGAQIFTELAADDSVTAVIGSTDMDINAAAAYVFNERSRLFIVPSALYDSVYENNNYKMVLSCSSSGRKIGECLETAAVRETKAQRWAVCAADDEFSMSEMRGFLQSNKSNEINIVDCSDILTLMSDFDNEINRLKSLGVEGIVIFPGEAYKSAQLFDLVKKIRVAAPDMICMGDSTFDDSAELLSKPEYAEAMTGFILAVELSMINDDEAEVTKFKKMRADFEQEYGEQIDLWYLYGYNMIRMIGDTAARHNTTNGADIARILHDEGYDGLCQKFVFDENGSQMLTAMQYYVMNDDGTAKEINVR